MIKKYTKKDGSTAYMLSLYLGIDPITNKEKRTTRRNLKSMREAKILEAKLRMEILHDGFINNEITTFQEIYNLWFKQHSLTIKESTKKTLIQRFNTIIKYFEYTPLQKMSVAFAQSVINQWFEKYKSYKMLISSTNMVLDYAKKLKIIKSNPFREVTIPKNRARTINDELLYYTSSELNDFLNLLEGNHPYYAFFRTLAFTGMRKGEALALTWNDIDFDKMTINIDKTVARNTKYELIIQTPKTEDSKRIVSIDLKTSQVLKEWRKHQRVESLKYGFNTSDKMHPVFTYVNRDSVVPPESLYRFYSDFCKKHNFKFIKVHGFRHTHCSLLFEAGVSIQEVKERLGHSNIQTTMDIYAHITEKQRDNVAEKFAKYVNF